MSKTIWLGMLLMAFPVTANAETIDKQYVEKSQAIWETTITRNLKQEATAEAKDRKTNTVIYTCRDRLIQKDGQQLVARDCAISDSPKNADSALCTNRQYVAHITKDAGVTDWSIRTVMFPEKDSESIKLYQYRPEGKSFVVHMSLFYVPIYKILMDEKSIKRATKLVRGGGEAYEIEFDYTKTGVPAHQVARIYGTMITDSRFPGVLASAKYSIETKIWTGSTEFECEVRPDSAGHPVLVSATSTSHINEPPGTEKHQMTTTQLEDFPVSSIKDEEFRLSAFGLPEPVGVAWEDPIKPTPKYVWILAGSGGFAMMAMVFAYFRNRLRRKPTSPTNG